MKVAKPNGSCFFLSFGPGRTDAIETFHGRLFVATNSISAMAVNVQFLLITCIIFNIQLTNLDDIAFRFWGLDKRRVSLTFSNGPLESCWLLST